MIADDIRNAISRDPFQPFRVVTSSGESYAVSNPGLVVPMNRNVFIAMPDGERYAIVSYLHVTAVETLPNGKPRRRRG